MNNPVLHWFRQNILLTLISIGYIVSVAYVVNEMVMHGHMYGVSGKNLLQPDEIDQVTFLFVLYAMSIFGFLMMVLMAGGMINNYRLVRETRAVYLKLSDQMRAVELAQDGVAILDKDGVYTYMNKAHAYCYGYEADELIGRNWNELYHPDQCVFFQKMVFPILFREGRWKGRSYGRRKDGSQFPQEVTLTLLEDGGLICVVRDITEKVETDTLLRIIKLAVEAADDGIAITDQEHKVLFMNRSFLKIHGYDPFERDSFIGTDWRLMYSEAGREQINSIVIPTTILKGSWCDCIPVLRKDGTLFYGDASLTKLPDGLILGVMRDVTERRKGDLEREELREKLFQSQKMEAISRLTYGIAKDFDVILSNITEAVAQNKLREVINETKRARDLLEQLMAFSQTRVIKNSSVDIVSLIADLQVEIGANLPDSIEFVSLIKTRAAFVQTGKIQAMQILKNICMNARDSLEGREGKIAITVMPMDCNLLGLKQEAVVDTAPGKLQALDIRHKRVNNQSFLMVGYIVRNRDYVQVTIADNGYGIPIHVLPSVFDPFFTTKAVGKGAGLGLSSVHGLMMSIGGAIIIETMQDQGTSVHLFFPKADVSPEQGLPYETSQDIGV